MPDVQELYRESTDSRVTFFQCSGNSTTFFLLYAITGLARWIILLFLPWQFAALYFMMVVLLNAMIAATSRQKIRENLLWLLQDRSFLPYCISGS